MKNLIHFDLKGIAPSAQQIKNCWLPFFKALEFDGVVIEYDCRARWKTWQNQSACAIYSDTDISEINQCGRDLGLEIIPLIQTLGHMEWLLTRERFAHLRENGSIRELCPSHSDTRKYIFNWIDETVKLHPGLKFIHLGSDETWDLASCPQCRNAVDERGKMGIYLDHVGNACRHALQYGVRPIIWGDMFCRENAAELIHALPREVILADWDYASTKTPGHAMLRQITGYEVWGASALQCCYTGAAFKAAMGSAPRAANIRAWRQQNCTVLHTMWGRPNNVAPVYPPFFALAKLFLTASGKKNFPQAAIATGIPTQCRKWDKLHRRFEKLYTDLNLLSSHHKALKAMFKLHTMPPTAELPKITKLIREMHLELVKWNEDVRIFFSNNALTDVDEFIATRNAPLRGL